MPVKIMICICGEVWDARFQSLFSHPKYISLLVQGISTADCNDFDMNGRALGEFCSRFELDHVASDCSTISHT